MDLSFIEDSLREQSDLTQRTMLIDKTVSTSKLVDGAIQTVRKVTTELRPAILDSMGLLAAIEWQAEEFQKRTGIICFYNSFFDDIELERDHSTAIFRIVQESLTNIARHAKATKVIIECKKDGDTLLLNIIDNGRSITHYDMKKTNSFGILGMKERASLLGGHIDIQGIQGKGTTVHLRVPLGK
jgi:signal transduction histidine kinase